MEKLKILSSIEGWLSESQAHILYNTALKYSNSNICEIGSYKGKSSIALGLACKKNANKLYCIDPWQGTYSDLEKCSKEIQIKFEKGFYEYWLENIEKAGVKDVLVPLKGCSKDVLTKDLKLKFKMAFIDGCHEYDSVIEDFNLIKSFLEPGSTLIFHDVTSSWPGAYKAWHQAIKTQLKKTQEIEGLGVGIYEY